MNHKKITINDIARELNISKSTVSRALREQSEINPETKKRILEYIEQIGYHPDSLAISLKTGKTKTIGVVIPAYNIPFYSIAICGIQDYAFEMGYNIMICHSNEKSDIEKENVKALMNSRIEGLIISVAEDNQKNEHIRRLKTNGTPLVMFNRVIEDLKASKVVVNDYYGAFNMTKYLLRQTRKKMLYLSGPSNLLLSANRRAGFMDAIKEYNTQNIEYEILEVDFTIENSYKIMKEVFSNKNVPDTVFCVCDAVAFGAMRAAKEFKLQIPKDIAIAGFTNEPASELVDPPLTTVSQPIYEIGRTAAKLLFNQLQNRDLPAELAVLDSELIIRESTRQPKNN